MMPDRKDISRRDFLKLGSIVMGALALHSCEKIGFVTPTPEGTQTNSAEVVPPPSSTIEATAPVSIQPMVEETPVAGATSTPEAVSPAVWAPPTLEQMVVEGRGGALDPEIAKYKFEEVIPNGLARIGIENTVVNFSDNGLSGNDYRWAPLTVNPEGLVIWAYDPAMGQLEWPVKLDPLLDAAGNTYYRLRTEGLSYQPVPDSEGAQFVWGGTKDGISGKFLAVLAKDPITLPDGRQIYSTYWDRPPQSWLPTPGLAELLATPTPEAAIPGTEIVSHYTETINVADTKYNIPVTIITDEKMVNANPMMTIDKIYANDDPDFRTRYGETAKEAIAHAVAYAEYQCWQKNDPDKVSQRSGVSFDAYWKMVREAQDGKRDWSEVEFQTWANDLTTPEYDATKRTFRPGNLVSIAYVNSYPGMIVDKIGFGTGMDINGNLALYIASYPTRALLQGAVVNSKPTVDLTRALDRLSWTSQGGSMDSNTINRDKERWVMQIFLILSQNGIPPKGWVDKFKDFYGTKPGWYSTAINISPNVEAELFSQP